MACLAGGGGLRQGKTWSRLCSRSDNLEIFHPKRYEISRAGDDIARWEEPRKTCGLEGTGPRPHRGRNRVMDGAGWMETRSRPAGAWGAQRDWER